MPAPHGQLPRGTARELARVAEHEEWLLDEAIKETFPASDPTAPYRSEHATAVARYRTAASVNRVGRRGRQPAFWWIIAAGALLFVGYVARRRRR